MLERVLAAAALALLVSGDAVRLGWGAVEAWHLLFPYVWLFLALEAARARRRLDDGAVFLAGGAMAMLYGGIYAKDLQSGLHPFGVDWLGAACAVFDGGAAVVLALHLRRRFARLRGVESDFPFYGFVFLAFVLATAVSVYAVKTAFNFYRADRMLGPTWLAADLLFAAAAWTLARRAWSREEGDGRESWTWGLCAFSVWLPGARLIAHACAAGGLSGMSAYALVAGWTAAIAAITRILWKERGYVEATPFSRVAAAAAVWRVAGTALVLLLVGADLNESYVPGLFSAVVDWPSRALFAWAFLTSRLEV